MYTCPIKNLIKFELDSIAIFKKLETHDILANCYTSLYTALKNIRDIVRTGLTKGVVTYGDYVTYCELIHTIRGVLKNHTLPDTHPIKLEVFISGGLKLQKLTNNLNANTSSLAGDI